MQEELNDFTSNKARLVAKGYSQAKGLDFDATYAPVDRLESIRILLVYATYHDFKLFQMDVKSAFLNGPITEEVYMLSNLPALKTMSILIMFISSQRRFMSLSKPQEHDMNVWETFLLLMVSKSKKVDPTLFTKTFDKDLFIC
jgi:hypothetical protein